MNRIPIILVSVLVMAHWLPAATVEYLASEADMANPERGFYVQHTARFRAGSPAPGPLNPSVLESHYASQMSLILRFYVYETSRDRALTPEQLDLITQDCAILRTTGIKAVLRFGYTIDPDDPDAPLATVLQHIDQLAPILHQNVDVIATVQAGFIGTWGEWHSSSNGLGTTANRRAILERLLTAVPSQRAVGLRTPRYKQAIFERSGALSAAEAFSGTDISRTGHHNDCFLASDTDYGTYLDPATEKAYLARETRYLPMGGETCHANPPRSACASSLEEMARLHWSYLNSTYHPSVLSGWSSEGCMEEVRRGLGYRLRLVRAELAAEARPGDVVPVHLELGNNGFASPYNPRAVEVVLRHGTSGETYDVTLPEDPRTWIPTTSNVHVLDARILLPGDLPEGGYDLYLSLPDPEPGAYGNPRFAIQLANPGGWEPTTGYNDLLFRMNVSAQAPAAPPVATPYLPLAPADQAPTPAILVTEASDTDADSLPDLWEHTHFGGITNALPLHDTDGDGCTNQEEYVAQTDPRDPDSVFRIVDVAGTGTPAIQYLSASGRVYALEGVSGLGDTAPVWQDMGPQQVGSGAPQQFFVPVGASGFSYRVRVGLP